MNKREKLIEEIMESLNAMKNKMHSTIVKGANRLSIPHSQWFLLCMISNNPSISIKEVSSMLGISSSATTQLVDALVKGGCVARKSNTKDRRSLCLEISPKGKKTIAMTKMRYAKVMESLFVPLNNKELKTFGDLYKKILININHE